MTRQQAETFLSNYRDLLKAWTMAVAGFSNEDSDALYRRLEEGQDELVEIALAYPDKGYTIDTLINSRSRTWAGFAAQHLPTPGEA